MPVAKRKQKPPRVDKFDKASKPTKKLYLCKNELKTISPPRRLQDDINEALGDGHRAHVDRLKGSDPGSIVPVPQPIQSSQSPTDNEQMRAKVYKEVYDDIRAELKLARVE
jgi:hypothetical protein